MNNRLNKEEGEKWIEEEKEIKVELNILETFNSISQFLPTNSFLHSQ